MREAAGSFVKSLYSNRQDLSHDWETYVYFFGIDGEKDEDPEILRL